MEPLELVRDFVNTADLEDGEDELADPKALRRWLAAHGLADTRARASASDLDGAVAVREAIRELLRANTGIEVEAARASAVLDAAARAEGLAVRFRAGSVELAAGGRGVGGVLAAVAETMVDGSWERLKACRSDTCRWAFIDNARNRSRQWCDMRVCGNRAKARTFRARHDA